MNRDHDLYVFQGSKLTGWFHGNEGAGHVAYDIYGIKCRPKKLFTLNLEIILAVFIFLETYYALGQHIRILCITFTLQFWK